MTWAKTQSFQQHAQYSATAVANTSVTLTSAVALGDTILLLTQCANFDVSFSNSEMSDQLGNAYNRLPLDQGGRIFNAVDAIGADLWWCIVQNAGTPTIKYTPDKTPSNVAWQAIKGSHFTGSDALSTREASSGLFSAALAGTDTIKSGTTGYTIHDGCLVWSCTTNAVIPPPTTTTTIGTGFTAGGGIDTTTGAIDEYKTQGTAGATSGTFSDTNTNDFVTIVIAISPAGGVAPIVAPKPGLPWYQTDYAQD